MRQFVCPGCGAVNRAPDGKDPAAARCGRCGGKIFTGKPVEVTAGELDAHRRSTQGAALLLDVWAPWCGPCRAMAPHFTAAAAQLEPDVRLLKLNSDAEPEAAAALGVSGIPALFLISGGRVVARRAGLMSADQIVAWARQSMAAAA
jgi:thioredoxin 2